MLLPFVVACFGAFVVASRWGAKAGVCAQQL
jgi:hypothetical protein